MNISTKLLKAAAGQAGAGLDIDEVFNTHLYDGDGTDDRAIDNGIDLSGEGGLVWIKNRDYAFDHLLGDTERGITKGIRSNNNNAENNFSDRIKTVTSTGFTIGTADEINSSNTGYTGSTMSYVAWTFRKAPKFFDIVTYTGNGTAGRTISHNLGSTPGMIMVKRTNATTSWAVYHRGADASAPEDYYLQLSTDSARINNTGTWNDTAPTSNNFTVGNGTATNLNGGTYVAYLFAHHANDGSATGFGPNGDSPVISCGSYDGNGSSTGPEINLGFEPQFIMVKRRDSTSSWFVYDVMRGIHAGLTDHYLEWNDADAENSGANFIDLTATGFKITSSNSNINNSSGNYMYMAIRRGPLAKPTDPSKVFHTSNNSFYYNFDSLGFDADFNINTRRSQTSSRYILTRMLDTTWLVTDTSSAEGSESSARQFWDYRSNWIDLSTSWWSSTSYTNFYSWRRAPSFCDVVAFTGTGSARTLNHNLGVAPEMIWLKQRNTSQSWQVYHAGIDASAPQDYYVQLDTTGARSNNSNRWNDTAPTSSVFSVGTAASVNGTNDTYIAYLFASLAGVSKLGSYTGDGSEDGSKVIDCGFSSGSRFVLIKRTDSPGGWQFFDGGRGIVAGNDSRLQLDNNVQQTTGYDFIDPDNSGFIVGVSTTSKNAFNVSGGNYIFYAIAN